jgi:hypothetical protein
VDELCFYLIETHTHNELCLMVSLRFTSTNIFTAMGSELKITAVNLLLTRFRSWGPHD